MHPLIFILFLGLLLGSQAFGQSPPSTAALMATGEQAMRRKDYVAALRAYEEALPLVRKSADETALGLLLKTIGDVHVLRNYFRPAIENYREALPLLRKTNQTMVQIDCLEKMAGIQAQFGYRENAINHYTRALKLKSELHDYPGVVFCHARLVDLLFAEQKYLEAHQHNQEVLRLAGADWATAADAAILEVVLLTFLARMEEANVQLDKTRHLLAGQTDSSWRIKLLSATSNFYLAQKDEAQAKIYLDSAKTLIQGTQNPELAIAALDQMAQIHQKNGDFKAAFESMLLLNRYKDIFRNKNIERISAEINDAAATALREKEIDFLQLKNQLNAAELVNMQAVKQSLLLKNRFQDTSLAQQARLVTALAAESAWRNTQLEQEKTLNLALNRENDLKQKNLNQEHQIQQLLWFGLGLLALLGGAIFYLYRKQQRNNAIIIRQSDELLVLNREVHHRVKNNLQVISSMLDLQSQILQDDHARQVIKEAILRVQAMAFIHQNLYLDDAANTVDMPDYIAMLADHLFNTYNIRPEKIHLELAVEPLRLHTDTAVPMGMILNELISNAMKYAFINRENGLIRVELRKDDQRILLRVSDNGVGLPPDFDIASQQSFGYEIIQAFAQKLKAKLIIEGTAGTDIQLLISKFRMH